MVTTKIDPRAATSRHKGAVGNNPLVYQAFRRLYRPRTVSGKLAVLDFGAGKGAVHTFRLREEGYATVFAHDLPDNMPSDFVPGWAPDPASLLWDVVLLSNVLNVQSSPEDVVETLKHIKSFMYPQGSLILNYPLSPRKSSVTADDLRSFLLELFPHASMSLVGGTAKAPCLHVVF